MIRKLGLAFVVAVLGLVSAVSVEAATTAGQDISFSTGPTVSIVSDAPVPFGLLNAPAQVDGHLTMSSNDSAGFSLTVASASGATVVETGPACLGKSFTLASVVTLGPRAITGMTSGSGGTAAAPFAQTGAVQSLFSVNPTGVGSTMHESIAYTIDPTGVPFNTNGCQYLWTETYTIAAS
jgi:hypothetical protein